MRKIEDGDYVGRVRGAEEIIQIQVRNEAHLTLSIHNVFYLINNKVHFFWTDDYISGSCSTLMRRKGMLVGGMICMTWISKARKQF